MKKILIIGSEFDSYRFHLAHIVNHLQSNNIIHLCVGFSGSTGVQQQLSKGKVTTTQFYCTRKPNIVSNLIFVFRLINYCKKEKFDIVLSFMPLPGFCSAIASLFFPKKTLYGHYYTGQVWAGNLDLKNRLYKFADMLIARFANFTLCDSASQAEFLLISGINQRDKPTKVIGKGSLCGVEVCNPPTKEIKQPLRVGYLARKTIKKGALDFINLATHFKDNKSFSFIFAGPDETAGIALDKYNQLKLSGCEIKWYGAIDDINSVLNFIDVLILPSYQEGFGTVVLDAAMRLVPTLGYRVTGLVDSIDDGVTGILVSPGRVDELIDVLKKFTTDREGLHKMGVRARENALKNFSRKFVLESLEKYLNDLQ
jgi:glycosyltransferase involved in cell wall biosynthesis